MHNFKTRPISPKSLLILDLERKYRLIGAKERVALREGKLERALDLQVVKKIIFRQLLTNK
jgi:hypothetical protein